MFRPSGLCALGHIPRDEDDLGAGRSLVDLLGDSDAVLAVWKQNVQKDDSWAVLLFSQPLQYLCARGTEGYFCIHARREHFRRLPGNLSGMQRVVIANQNVHIVSPLLHNIFLENHRIYFQKRKDFYA